MGFLRKMRFSAALISLMMLLQGSTGDQEFDKNYGIDYGNDHVSFTDQEVDLKLDEHTGAGFSSKHHFGFGVFTMRIKTHPKDSAGVVTTFYLTLNDNSQEELDFEFLGNREGKPTTLQTNVIVNGHGEREQRFYLWFDPAQDFHDYMILWNEHISVFFVDNTPIRVYRNLTAKGVPYTNKAMKVKCSIWNATWATDGGKTPIDWSHGPFYGHYSGGFRIDNACPSSSDDETINQHCYSTDYWWNGDKFRDLDAKQQKAFAAVRKRYMNYDYCDDKNKHPDPPLECKFNVPVLHQNP